MKWFLCTQKLLKELNRPVGKLESASNAGGLGNWYVNLLVFQRRKHLLFTNEKTIYSFLVPEIFKEELKNISTLFLMHLAEHLRHEGISSHIVDLVLKEYKEVGFTKTANRQILGFMNDIANQYECFIGARGKTLDGYPLEMTAQINRSPMSAGKRHGFYPIERLKTLLHKCL